VRKIPFATTMSDALHHTQCCPPAITHIPCNIHAEGVSWNIQNEKHFWWETSKSHL